MSAPIKARSSWNEATQGLWEIAETGELGQLEHLLARGADVNARNNAGVTPLMVAAYHGRFEMVRALTDYGADANAMDHDGFTAAMLADHLGHKDIVTILVARSGKRVPRPSAYDTSSGLFVPVETFDAFSDAEVTASPANPEVRTLHEPPNIWDLVHETPADFNPRSAFFGHFTSLRPFLLVLIAIIAGGGALYGLMKLVGGSASSPAEPAAGIEEARNPPSSPPVNAARTTAPLEQARTLPASGPEPATVPLVEEPPAPPPAGLAAIAVTPKRTGPFEADKHAAARRRQKEPSTSVTGEKAFLGSAETAGGANKAEKSSTPSKSDSALPKSDGASTGDPNGAKKTEVKKESDKAPSPESNAPAKTSPSPKAKVINWP